MRKKKRKRWPQLTIGNQLSVDDLRTAEDFLNRNHGRDCEIIFDSDGGICEVGIELNKLFKAHGQCLARIYKAESAAAVALLGCKWRIGEPLCTVYVHAPYSTEGRKDSKVEDLGLLCAALVARDTGQDISRVLFWMKGSGHELFDHVAKCTGFLHCMNPEEGLPLTLLKAKATRAGHKLDMFPQSLTNPKMLETYRNRLRGNHTENRRFWSARHIR